jgi:hypothetical protein
MAKLIALWTAVIFFVASIGGRLLSVDGWLIFGIAVLLALAVACLIAVFYVPPGVRNQWRDGP